MTQMALRVEYDAHWTCLDPKSQGQRVYSTLRGLCLITCWTVTKFSWCHPLGAPLWRAVLPAGITICGSIQWPMNI